MANFQRARRSPGETAFGRSGLPGGNGLASGNGLGGAAAAETPAEAAGNGEFFAEDAVAGLAAGDGPGTGPDGDPGSAPGRPPRSGPG